MIYLIGGIAEKDLCNIRDIIQNFEHYNIGSPLVRFAENFGFDVQNEGAINDVWNLSYIEFKRKLMHKNCSDFFNIYFSGVNINVLFVRLMKRHIDEIIKDHADVVIINDVDVDAEMILQALHPHREKLKYIYFNILESKGRFQISDFDEQLDIKMKTIQKKYNIEYKMIESFDLAALNSIFL